MPRIIDVLEFTDHTGEEIVHREPEYGPGDFRFGSQVVVRPNQVAIFVRGGKALDALGPGTHTISTSNIPILADLIGMATGGKTPFQAEVIFVSLKQFEHKWGTPNPIMYMDPDQMVGRAQLRARGGYSCAVADATLFVDEIVGQQNVYDTKALTRYMRGRVVSHLRDLVTSQRTSVFELQTLTEELNAAARVKLSDVFSSIGLNLIDFYIEDLSLDEETWKRVQDLQAKAAEARVMMEATGQSDYMRYMAAESMRDAANNPGEAGGTMGAGMGFGMGMGMSNMMNQMMNPQQQGQQGQQGQQQGYPQQQQQGYPPQQGQQQGQQGQQGYPPQQQQTPPPQQQGQQGQQGGGGGGFTRDQILQAIDTLDMRFSMGEISEEMYNRMMQKWQTKLQEMGG